MSKYKGPRIFHLLEMGMGPNYEYTEELSRKELPKGGTWLTREEVKMNWVQHTSGVDESIIDIALDQLFPANKVKK